MFTFLQSGKISDSLYRQVKRLPINPNFLVQNLLTCQAANIFARLSKSFERVLISNICQTIIQSCEKYAGLPSKEKRLKQFFACKSPGDEPGLLRQK
jgi:hypothetical protein